MATAAAPQTDLQLEIVADRKELLKGLSTVIGVVERKTTIPILANVLLEATSDGFLKIAATNLDQSVRTSVPVQVRCEGSLAVPARKLHDYIKLLSGDEVKILQEENNWIQIRCGRSKTKMVGMDRKNYPQLPEPGDVLAVMDARALRFLIEKTQPCISNEEARYTINGALLKLKQDAMVMVSTDGTRLSHASKSETIEGKSADFLIPAAAIAELHKLIGGETASAQLSEDDTTIFFKIGLDTLLTTRKTTGKFPNYEAVMPKYSQTGVLLDTETMAATIARCLLFSNSDTRAIVLQVADKELRVKAAAADLGETEEVIEILNGPDLTIGFNGDFLKDLFALTEGAVEMQLKDSGSPALFTWRTDDGFTLKHVIMPMALRGK